MGRYNPMRSGEQIDKVVDSIRGGIQFVYVDSLSGTLSAEELAILIANDVNRLVYSDTIYYLSKIEGNKRMYFSRVQSSVNNEIDVNITNGSYSIISKADPLVSGHIGDSSIHVTTSEKDSWNSKVTAEAELISGSEYQLVFSDGIEREVDED